MIKIWSQFSSNNSTSCRLIARFADAALARETAAELAEFFDDQAKLGDHRRTAGPLATMARNYGFEWIDNSSDDPHVVADDRVVIVYHRMTLGLGPGMAAYLEDRGGVPEPTRSSWAVQTSVLFQARRGADPGLDAELEVIFAQPIKPAHQIDKWNAPWVTRPVGGSAAWFRDAATVAIYFPCHPEDLARLRGWLSGHGIDHVMIELEPDGDRDLFAAIAAARCTACGGPLDYLDPRLHDIETPQLVCAPCGGLYDLTTFVPE